VGQRYLVACYNMQTSVMLYFTHGDMATAARSCLGRRSRSSGVFPGLGREVGAYARQDHTSDPDVLAASAEQKNTSRGVTSGVVKNFID